MFYRDVFFPFLFLSLGYLRAPLADRHETLPHDRNLGALYNASPKIRGALPPKKLRAKNMQNSTRFQTTSNFDCEYLQNASIYAASGSNFSTQRAARQWCSSGHNFWEGLPPKIWEGKIWRDFRQLSTLISNVSWTDRPVGKVLDQLQPLPRWAKKTWWTLVHKQKSYRRACRATQIAFSGDYILALRGCWPLKFLHTLEIDQGLLAHTPNGDGGLPKKFKGEHVKLGLKFRVCVPVTLGLVGITSHNFSTRRTARQGC